MRRRQLLWLNIVAFSFVFAGLAGCATPLPVAELQPGKPLAEIQKVVGDTPKAVNAFRAPDDPNEQLKVLEYEFALPNSQDQRPYPHWLLFHKDRFVAYGLGRTREAEFNVNRWYVDYLLKEKKIKQGEGERRIRDIYVSLYGPPHPLMDEFVTYKILIADKLDAGKIERAEADHLISKKWAEVSEKLAVLEHQRAIAEAQQRSASALQSQMLMQMSLGLMQVSQPVPVVPETHTYTVQPLGQGWIMQGR